VSSKVGFLAHFQSIDARPACHVSQEIAEQLVTRLAAQRISQKLIRALPPDSVMLRAVPKLAGLDGLPVRLAPYELPGLRWIPPTYARGGLTAAAQRMALRAARELANEPLAVSPSLTASSASSMTF